MKPCHLCESESCKTAGSRSCINRQVADATVLLNGALGHPKSRKGLLLAAKHVVARVHKLTERAESSSAYRLDTLEEAIRVVREFVDAEAHETTGDAVLRVVSEHEQTQRLWSQSEQRFASLLQRAKAAEETVQRLGDLAGYLMAYVQHHGPTSSHHHEDCQDPDSCVECVIDAKVNKLCVQLERLRPEDKEL